MRSRVTASGAWVSVHRRNRLIAASLLLAACYAGSILAALLTWPMVFAAAALAATLCDVWIERRLGVLAALLRRAQCGFSHRTSTQVFLLLLLVASSDARTELGQAEFLVFTIAALAVPTVRIWYLGLLTLAHRRARRPVLVRNIELPDDLHSPSLPPLLSDRASLGLLAAAVFPVVAGAVGTPSAEFRPFYVLAFAYTAFVVAAGLLLTVRLIRLARVPGTQQYLDAVSRALQQQRPEVVLYHSGSAGSVYQVDMWLTTLQRMRRSSVILLRERHAFHRLARTDLPVVCIPRAVDVMNFALPDTRIALYVANVGNDIHLLREPRVKHVFIGHGDSDKVGSFNPFSKVYDQIWVAGPAGRDRYARAKVGVRDDAIVEVGRPPVDAIERRAGTVHVSDTRPLTVLYLPTWEGWTDDDFQTSLTSMGEELVTRLLASPVPVRVVYRPHPLTGHRAPRARAADARIRALLAAATAQTDPVDAGPLRQLDRLATQIRAQAPDVGEQHRLVAEWNSLFWKAHAGCHLVADGRLPQLYDCFNEVDLLIADLSSVVTDFMASGKPYVVTNSKGLDDDEFRRTFPSAAASYLLSPRCAELDQILAAVTGADPMSEAREAARAYFLGPDGAPAIARWDDAVERLRAAAEVEWDGQHGAGPRLNGDAPPDVTAEDVAPVSPETVRVA